VTKKQAKENQTLADKVGQFEESVKNANEEKSKLVCANKTLQLQVQFLTDQTAREKPALIARHQVSRTAFSRRF
jgi:hypothetical protein